MEAIIIEIRLGVMQAWLAIVIVRMVIQNKAREEVEEDQDLVHDLNHQTSTTITIRIKATIIKKVLQMLEVIKAGVTITDAHNTILVQIRVKIKLGHRVIGRARDKMVI